MRTPEELEQDIFPHKENASYNYYLENIIFPAPMLPPQKRVLAIRIHRLRRFAQMKKISSELVLTPYELTPTLQHNPSYNYHS